MGGRKRKLESPEKAAAPAAASGRKGGGAGAGAELPPAAAAAAAASDAASGVESSAKRLKAPAAGGLAAAGDGGEGATSKPKGGLAVPWVPGMSKYSGVNAGSSNSQWYAQLRFKRESARTMEDAEEFFELMCAHFSVDPATKLRPNYPRDAAAAASNDSSGGDTQPDAS